MTVIEAIKQIFLDEKPNGTFAFTDEIQADKNERFLDKSTATPLCLIAPNVTGEGTLQNSNYTDRFRLNVFFLDFAGDNHKKYIDKETDHVEPMRQLGFQVLTRVFYQYPELIQVDNNTSLNHQDTYNWGSGNHAGTMFTIQPKQKRALSLCSKGNIFDLTISNTNGQSIPQTGSYQYNLNENITLYPLPDFGYQFDKWVINSIDNLNRTPTIAITEDNNVEGVYSEIAVNINCNIPLTPELSAELAFDLFNASLVSNSGTSQNLKYVMPANFIIQLDVIGSSYIFDSFTINSGSISELSLSDTRVIVENTTGEIFETLDIDLNLTL